MENQSFNLNADFLGGYTGVFMKFVVAIFLIYGFIMLVNFFRDKFINKENISKDPQIINLLSILNKLFYYSGFGFIIGNIIQVLLNKATGSGSQIQFKGEWDYLTFGIILIFIGIGLKVANKAIQKR